MTLKTAVGLGNCAACICDVNGSGGTNATDALLVLQKGVGQQINLTCLPC